MLRHLPDNARGALYIAISVAGYAMNDAMMKMLSGEVPLFQAIFSRGVSVTAFFGALLLWSGDWRVCLTGRDRRLIGLRAVGETLGSACFLAALFNMPLANATAILQSLPLAITLGAALFLGERVGWRRYLTIAIGFAGVMIIVRPGSDGFNVYALAALAGVAFMTLRELPTRLISPACSAIYLSFFASLAITVVSGLVALTGPMVWLTPAHLVILGASTLALALAYHFSVLGMRVGDVAAVSPFRYTILLWAMLFGWLIYDDVPDLAMLIGASVIVASGLFAIDRRRPVRSPRN